MILYPKPCPFCAGPLFVQPGYQGIQFVLCGQLEDGSDGCGATISFRGDASTDRNKTIERLNRREFRYAPK